MNDAQRIELEALKVEAQFWIKAYGDPNLPTAGSQVERIMDRIRALATPEPTTRGEWCGNSYIHGHYSGWWTGTGIELRYDGARLTQASAETARRAVEAAVDKLEAEAGK